MPILAIFLLLFAAAARANSFAAQQDDYGDDFKISRQFFPEEAKCRGLIRSEKWAEAETVCKGVVRLAEKFKGGRELEKMGAYELFGRVMLGQKRYREALDSYALALNAVKTRLTERNAELGCLYGEMAVAWHLLGDLDKALELYRKAEKIYQTAYAFMGNDEDVDAEVVKMKQGYLRALKNLLELHLMAAEKAGATSDAEEAKRLMKSLP
jgi:tetratricopeptide (TPR) repeat protein